MTLVEACEPLFQYVAGLCRALGKGANPRPETVKRALKDLLAGMRESCSGSQTLLRQFEDVELPLIFFTDFLITETRSRFAKNWEPLAFERDELAGDDKFFQMLEAELGQTGPDADEKLRVYHVCLGLGFAGIHASDPDSPALADLRARVTQRVTGGAAAPTDFSPSAYRHVDRSDLIEGSGLRIWALLILLVGMVGLLVVVNFFQFKWESDETLTSVRAILDRSGGPGDGGAAAPEGEEKP